MSQSGVLIVLVCLFFHVKAQNPSNSSESSGILKPLHLNLAVVLGVVSAMLALTFLILAYAKFCSSGQNSQNQTFQGLIRSGSRFSGLDRNAIDSLPFFRFSSLKGSKQGLECAVCISRFEDSEILRLLPKCRHAFHRNCIDQWLHSHSSCPICRYKFDPEDLKSFTYSNSLRYSPHSSNLTQDPNIELFVEREPDNNHEGSSRFNKDELLVQECNPENNRKLLHKFKHKIIVSDVVTKNRWSDVNSSDFLFLNSEMLNVMSSNRFSPSNASLSVNQNLDKIKEDMERKRFYESRISRIERSNSFSENNEERSSKMVSKTEKRSMSEIINLSRNRESRNCGKDERTRRLWLPIARKTVQWFAGRERNMHELEYRRQELNV